ncbi:UDP-Gal:alpha-D-GlcNAc-diphosphoundecaprenol beta-1,3-galactosyltransferase [compost metagenome]
MIKHLPSDVAVLLATHNDGAQLEEAVQSLAHGTHPVDIFIVDDGSTPAVVLPSSLSATIIRLDANVGLTRALNIGLNHILSRHYSYIARMDADDRSHPERIARQLQMLEERPDLAGVGCWANFVSPGSDKVLFTFRPPTTPAEISRELLTSNCILHPSWLLRTDAFASLGGYDERFPVAQDYELLARANAQGLRFANVGAVLLDYRVSPNGISLRRRRKQLRARLHIQYRHFQPAVLRCWLALGKTMALMCIPEPMLRRAKQYLGSAGSGVAG